MFVHVLSVEACASELEAPRAMSDRANKIDICIELEERSPLKPRVVWRLQGRGREREAGESKKGEKTYKKYGAALLSALSRFRQVGA